jgi:PST family polysaccharide transporter
MEVHLNMREAATKGVVWSAAQRYGERAISFLVLLILARLLTPAAFGLVAMASVFIAFAQIFIDQGFGDAVVQALQIDQKLLNTAFWTNLITGILIMLLSVIHQLCL